MVLASTTTVWMRGWFSRRPSKRPAASHLAVVPITPSGEVLLVRQLRPPVRDALLEVPAGLLDVEGEDALTCAARELREETGYPHETIEFLGGCYTSAGLMPFAKR